MSTNTKISVIAYTSKNPEKQTQFMEMIRASKILTEGVEIIIANSDQEALHALPNAEVLLCYEFPPQWLSHAIKLKWMHVGWAGIDHVLTPELAATDIILTNARGIHVEVQSDYIIGAIILWSRKLMWADRFKQERKWFEWRKPMVIQGFPVRDRILLIVGLGAIGRAVAQKAHAMGMQVHGIKRSPIEGEGFPYISKWWKTDQLHEALSHADIVAPLVPYTKETHGMIDAEFFRHMKSSAFFINTSRGKVVNQADLIHVLQEKRIAGAVLDVYEEEPLPQDSPLWELDNVILTPHIAGNFPEYTMDTYAQFVENLERYVKDEPLMNVVDKQLGY
jgi:phosphoglycerate dehydrogenase-like enzyme